jgi:hypothetical protein
MATARQSRRRFLGASLKAAAAAGLVSGCRNAGTQGSGHEAESPMRTITVTEGKYGGATGAAIQQAVDDAAAAGGGAVIVPPGIYSMRDALHLRSRVRIVGRDGAVLKKTPSVESRIPDFLGYGHYEVTVEEPDKFPVGTGIHILDDNAGGFYTTVATVIGREGDRLYINRMLNHDYHVARRARVISVYPIIDGDGVEQAAVEGLAIDGNAAEETFMLNGCRGGGVFLIRCGRVALRNLDVRNYRGDGISFQQCTDILVDRCRVHHNVGHGLHPGSGSVRYVMQDCLAHDNGNCGVFYCLRTTHSICRRNEFRNNGQAGISIGERDTDHLIEANTVAGNGEEGVLLRPPTRTGGDRVLVIGNRIGPNGARQRRAEISIPAGLSDVHILENTFAAGASAVISLAQGSRRISFAGNKIGEREAGPGDIAGAAREVLLERPKDLPAVGPAALALEGARHLNVPRLPPWDEPRMWSLGA